MSTLRIGGRSLVKVLLPIGLFALLAACQPAATEIATPDLTALAAGVMTDVAEEDARIATSVAETLEARPTATSTMPAPTDTAAPTRTPRPTNTVPPTDTPLPSPSATNTPRPVPTLPPVTNTPTVPPAPASIYGFTGGPEGYFTDIDCSRPAGNCEAVMPPGDISFRFFLGSEATAPWTLFFRYGLSVEKDGVNVADMFMFVDAGWLPPDTTVSFGASRNFIQPGRYIIRSSGCLINSETQVQCLWSTMAGTTVTFVIQP